MTTQPPADNERLAADLAHETVDGWYAARGVSKDDLYITVTGAIRTALSAQAARLAAAVAAERERCAQIAENSRPIALHVAAAIRTTEAARVGETPE